MESIVDAYQKDFLKWVENHWPVRTILTFKEFQQLNVRFRRFWVELNGIRNRIDCAYSKLLNPRLKQPTVLMELAQSQKLFYMDSKNLFPHHVSFQPIFSEDRLGGRYKQFLSEKNYIGNLSLTFHSHPIDYDSYLDHFGIDTVDDIIQFVENHSLHDEYLCNSRTVVRSFIRRVFSYYYECHPIPNDFEFHIRMVYESNLRVRNHHLKNPGKHNLCPHCLSSFDDENELSRHYNDNLACCAFMVHNV